MEKLMDIDQGEIVRLTEEYGGQWGINHTRRLLHLIAIIGDGQAYDADAVWLAAHLHDWGAYPAWAQKDVDHALRSRQVADAFLTERSCPQALKDLVLECIELHHVGGANRSLESILLRDADILDFLGIVGVLRDFSKNARELRKAYTITKQRREQLPSMLSLDKAKVIAEQRVKTMDELLARFEEDSFGCY
jgi:HD superfamily phosphodiesterase